MFYYPTMLSRYQETSLASFIWVGIEEIKRFNLALYKVCGKVSSDIVAGAGIDDHDNAETDLLNASELQFPLPSSSALWSAIGKDEWIVHMKDTTPVPVSLDDHCRAGWISNSAILIEFLEL